MHPFDLTDALQLVLVCDQIGLDGFLTAVRDPVHANELVDRRTSGGIPVEHTFYAVSCILAARDDFKVYFLRRDYLLRLPGTFDFLPRVFTAEQVVKSDSERPDVSGGHEGTEPFELCAAFF